MTFGTADSVSYVGVFGRLMDAKNYSSAIVWMGNAWRLRHPACGHPGSKTVAYLITFHVGLKSVARNTGSSTERM